MADRAKKISELTALANASGVDAFVIVDNHSAANAVTKKITLSALFADVASNTVMSGNNILSANTLIVRYDTTPANSTVAVSKGTIWADADYLYVAVANNTIKRIGLSAF